MIEPISYELKRSRRKTLAIEIDHRGSVIVRAPQRISKKVIEAFIDEKRDWIQRHRDKVLLQNKKEEEERSKLPPITSEDIKRLSAEMKAAFPLRIDKYAGMLGVTYGRITIRCQKTRWGSCSAKGNLNFNCLLMMTPEKIQDYVIVHELCHRLEMNHSPAFWAHVERVFPDHRECRRWLREEGSRLLILAEDGRGEYL